MLDNLKRAAFLLFVGTLFLLALLVLEDEASEVESYDQQTKSYERQEEEIKNVTKQLKHKENELEKFMVYINV